MPKLNFLAVFLALQISLGFCWRRELFKFPINCKDDEVHPWSQGCKEYIQCKGPLAEIRQCPDKVPENLKQICAETTSPKVNECKFQCDSTTEREQVGFLSPDGKYTPYWGLCIKGIIILQGKCSLVNNYTSIFESNKCLIKCLTDETKNIAIDGDCKKYMECLDGEGTVKSCGENAPLYFINGLCQYRSGDYQCPQNTPTSVTPSELTTVTPPVSSSTNPVTVSTVTPSVSSSTNPVTVSTGTPSVSSSTNPVTVSTVTPSVSSSTNPVTVSTITPSVSSSTNPATVSTVTASVSSSTTLVTVSSATPSVIPSTTTVPTTRRQRRPIVP